MSSFRRIPAFFLVLSLLFSIVPTVPAAASPLSVSGISARAALLLDATDGARRVLWEHNSDERLGMASTTKIMTALVALERMPLGTVISVPREAVGVEGSSLYLTAGEELSLEQLLFGVLLQSANDAAAAVAIAVGGSLAGFAALMNEKAAALGLSHTHFTNPHGLDDEEHYTTAHDLAFLAAAALENELFAAIVSTYRKEIPGPDGSVRLLINHNRLLCAYDGCIGVKTGFTKATGRCLVSAAERDGLRLVSVTLDDGDDWNDHTALLDAGFAAYEAVDLLPLLTLPDLPVAGGEQSAVRVRPLGPCRAVLPKSHGEIRVRIEMPHFVFAPVRSSQEVGRVVFTCGGTVIGICPVVTAFSAARTPAKRKFFGK